MTLLPRVFTIGCKMTRAKRNPGIHVDGEH